jgi:DNA-binding CsgD family transcriptional regulator
MSDINRSAWYRALAILRQSIGTSDFYNTFFSTLQQVVDFDYCGVFVYSDDHVDCALLQGNSENYHKFVDLYLDGLYLLDPHYSMLAKGAETGLYRFRDIAPDCYHNTEYYQRFVKPVGITDEFDFIIKIHDRYYDLYIDKFAGTFTDDDIRVLRTITPLLLDFAEAHGVRHSNLLTDTQSDHRNQRKSYSSIFDSLGTSLLTQREQDVFQCILHGHSSKSTANKLNIALGTVKIHRRNIYNKLDISSQSELFSLCVQSLAIPQVSEAADPLAALRESYSSPAPE